MAAQTVAGTFDLYDHSVVQEPVKKGGGDHRIAEDLASFGEAAV